jgi:hypothetical protein
MYPQGEIIKFKSEFIYQNNQREVRQREAGWRILYTYITVAVSWQDIWARKLNCSFFVVAYLALFNDVFEPLSLFFILM